jgi:hypothetical protein
MVHDVRSTTASGVVFDLLSPEGIMQALSFLRRSTASSEEKRALRDLIFLYTNSGGDEALRTLILNRLSPLSVPLSEAESVTATSPASVVTPVDSPRPLKPMAGFGGGRGTPQFKPLPVPTVTPMPESAVMPVPAAPVEPVVTHLPVTPVVNEVPAISHASVPEAVVNEKLASVAPVAENTVAYEPLYREDASLDDYRNRISEIKRTINARVGNPVNLVDIDNNLGREYMTTLLEAMKAVSGGGGDVVGVMKRLETTVAAVIAMLDAHGTVSPTPLPAVPPQVAPIAPVVASREPAPVVSVLPKAPATTPVAPAMPQAPTAPITPVSEVAVPVLPQSVMATMPVASVSIPIVSDEKIDIDPMTIASSRFKNVAPVSVAEPLKTPADLPTPADLKARMGIVDPLEDPDVDSGLDQLLGEWSLFKKSGMFGTGPRGRQHPLYLKLASLPVPLILSGRFEGATPEIRQSITDYMNGWRYEQGVIHASEETFEHYLRRVIRHIIDSQTRRRSA